MSSVKLPVYDWIAHFHRRHLEFHNRSLLWGFTKPKQPGCSRAARPKQWRCSALNQRRPSKNRQFGLLKKGRACSRARIAALPRSRYLTAHR